MKRRLLIFALAFLGALGLAAAQETILIDQGSSTKYLANSTDPGIGLSWTAPGFDDSAWLTGNFGVGYDTNPPAGQNLIQTPVPSTALTIYTRTTFEVADVSSVTSLILGCDWDDGFAVWLNGIEIFRSATMTTAPLGWDTSAGGHESSNGANPQYEFRGLSQQALPLLQDGTNLLAIGAYNQYNGEGDDLILAPQLIANRAPFLSRAPYLQRGTATGVTVRWRTDTPSSGRVHYGTAHDNLTNTISGTAQSTQHEVEISDLSPDTRYYYAVGTETEILAGGDDEHFFRTSPVTGDTKATRVWVLGDSGTGSANARAVRDRYYEFTGDRHTDLWLMLGDNAYQNGTDTEYQFKMFEIFPEMLRKSVLWPTIGNHDGFTSNSSTQSGPYFDIFSLPTLGEAGGIASNTEAYYSFDYGNIHFIVLDSNGTNRLLGQPMMNWLESDLMNTNQEWIIAFWHHPPYSKGSHDSDNPDGTDLELVEMRDNAIRLLDDWGVDLTLSGHSHSYERSFLIEGHYGLSDSFLENMKVDGGSGRPGPGEDGPYFKPEDDAEPHAHSGTVHTVCGSSGQSTPVSELHRAMYVEHELMGSVVLDVEANRLDATFLDKDGNVQDYFTLVKGVGPTAPVADFSTSPALGPAPLTVDFTDLSSHFPVQWAWDFEDDGGVDSPNRNPVHQYTQPGLYSVELIATNALGSNSRLETDLICVHPPALAEVTNLALGGGGTVAWDAYPGASSYDLLRGSLDILLSTSGDFAAAQNGCPAEDIPSNSTIDTFLPPPGETLFYLVRASDCAGRTGTYDGPVATPPRDPGLQGPAAVCGCDLMDDPDLDGICGFFDNCTDSDGDGLGDPGFPANNCAPDNCPTAPNPLQADLDGDGDGDACDLCTDTDGDGAADPGFPAGTCPVDNCPGLINIAQDDDDLDGLGDLCDPCTDLDGDGFGDAGYPANSCSLDNCPIVVNPSQGDLDADSVGDACDPCTDTDDDGLGNPGFSANVCPDDNCPDTSNPLQQDFDGDTFGDLCDPCTDTDGDGFGDPGFSANICPDDNCPDTHNPLQGDLDGDSLGDACDTCTDSDGDGLGNPGFPSNDPDTCPVDNCPDAANPAQEDLDGDGDGDACDLCTDTDSDGFANPGFPASSCPVDNCPTMPNASQADVDNDGLGNVCDDCPIDPSNDVDDDGLCANEDNCSNVPNPTQDDLDNDGMGDVCDSCTDTDTDGYGNPGFLSNVCPLDNCPTVPNRSQADFDVDGEGDSCDLCTDRDNDGYGDPSFQNLCSQDNCPTMPNASQADFDSDGIGNACRFVIVEGSYFLASTEVTNAEYVLFLNAVAGTDPQGLYDSRMGTDPAGGIDRSTRDDRFEYTIKPGMERKPVNFVDWLSTARYANWFQNGQPVGPQASSSTENGVYDLSIDDAGATVVREPSATWFLPSALEWSRAAYSDPTRATDWLYPTRSDTVPRKATATPDGEIANPGPNTVNYGQVANWNGSVLGNVTSVASAGSRSLSYWGTYDQAGNVAEWTEDAVSGKRVVKGGSHADDSTSLLQSSANEVDVDERRADLGFRMATFESCVDLDGDGFGLPGSASCISGGSEDCAPTVPGVANLPGTVGSSLSLEKSGGESVLHWSRGPEGHTSNIYRAVVPAGGPAPIGMGCYQGATPLLSVSDAEDPQVGEMFFYRVEARNRCGDAPANPAHLPFAPICPPVGGDWDSDGVPDLDDNCPLVANSDQADADGDMTGDACAP